MIKFIHLFLSTCLLSAFCYGQSAWTKKKNEGYLQLQYNTIPTYNEVFQDSEDLSEYPYREQTQMSLNFYGEFGISDKTTLITHIPLKILKSGDLNPEIDWHLIDPIYLPPSETATKLGNIELGIRQNILSKSIVLSAQLNVELNTSYYNSKTGVRTGYDAYSFIPTLNIGKGWNRSYIQGFTGLALRTNDYFQSFKIGVEFGYKVTDNLWAIAFIDGLQTIDKGSKTNNITDSYTYLYVNDQEYMAFGFKVNYDIKDDFGINLGLGGAFTANRVAKKPSMALGVFKKI